MVNLKHSCPITQSEGAKTFVTRLYSITLTLLPRIWRGFSAWLGTPYGLVAPNLRMGRFARRRKNCIIPGKRRLGEDGIS